MPTADPRGVVAASLPGTPPSPQGPLGRRELEAARLAAAFGAPREARLVVPMHRWEMSLLRMSRRDGRYRDATILIPFEGKLVCIVKHAYPDGIARPPSGGVVPGEPVDAAAEREAFEETGLRVRLSQYLLRVSVEFTVGDDLLPAESAFAEASRRGAYGLDAVARYGAEHPVPADHVERWESHVFWAEPVGGALEPRDVDEVKEIRLLAAHELEGPVHAAMRGSGIGGFRYRVALQEEALATARGRGLLA